MTMATSFSRSGALALLCGLLAASVLAPAVGRGAVPTRFPFQGLLLDASGQPVTDTVDLDFAIFDALESGTALWSESQLGVAVVDGVYSVTLGSEMPVDVSLLEGGVVFLEIRVNGEPLVPRQQLLSVPYARVAETTQSVGALPGAYFEQIVSAFPFDGSPPDNLHPDEGLADVDGDGLANFVDSDNDGDGLSDADELLLGNSINLVSPRLTQVVPGSVASLVPVSLVVSGTNLSTVALASFADEEVVPTDITPTSFRIEVTPSNLAPSAQVIATLANGETGSSPDVTITSAPPTISSISPPFAPVGQPTEIVIQGTNFVLGTQVFLSNPTVEMTPSAISSNSMTVPVPAQPSVGQRNIQITTPNGFIVASFYVAATAFPKTVFASTVVSSGNLGGLAGADATCQSNASAAGLAGTYRAWLGTSTAGPSDRLPDDAGPYVLPGGQLVATSWTDLTDETITRPIDSVASGAPVGFARVWTGADGSGNALPSAADTCSDWTSSTGTGRTGIATNSNSTWTDSAPSQSCGTFGFRLYCFQE